MEFYKNFSNFTELKFHGYFRSVVGFFESTGKNLFEKLFFKTITKQFLVVVELKKTSSVEKNMSAEIN